MRWARLWAVAPGPPRLASTVAELVAGATRRVVVERDDGKSGSVFEQVEIGGERYFLKSLGWSTDWIMRVTGDRDCRTFRAWSAGVMDRVPAEVDHAVVGMAVEGSGVDARLSILMRDVGDRLVPEGDDVVAPAVHAGFVDHLAAMAAAYWDWDDDLGLTSIEDRLRFFAPDNIASELTVSAPPVPLVAAQQGWAALAERAPELHRQSAAIHAAPAALVDALRRLPHCFLHGDWKMGNLGRHADGRTILLDWAYPGAGPPAWDLLWYLALNRARIPESKEAAIERYRSALDGRGVATAGWFDEQLALCAAGMMATFGWEKALGPDEELRWWEARALAAWP